MASRKETWERNLIPKTTDQDREEAARNGRKGGLKKGENARQRRKIQETAKLLLSMKVEDTKAKAQLKAIGIEESDMNFQTAMVTKQMQKALQGDTTSARYMTELTGDTSFMAQENTEEIVEYQYPRIILPDNGRDKRPENVIMPQAGPQTMFLTTKADIAIYGGAAGGGKTYGLLMEPLRHKDHPGFGAVIFRKNYTQITSEGGLWDAANKVYSQVEGAISRKTPKMNWSFAGGAKVNFAQIADERDLQSWMGSEICLLCFDELTHFSRHQFLYMLSRNRSTCGVRPYVRATCNPDADSWVADFISWWIDPDTGYPIPERSGRVRYMCVISDTIFMANTREELAAQHDISPDDCKSVTFIASTLQDNRILMATDPGYMANLKALTEVDKERLLKGNWKIKASAGKYFKRSQIPVGGMMEQLPSDITFWCRAWDLAATADNENGEGDYTAGVLVGKRANGRYIVADVINQKIAAGEVENLIMNTTKADRAKYGFNYRVRIPQDPGAAGKIVASSYTTMLAGVDVASYRVTGSKELRATPFAAQWQNGNIDIMAAEWNEMYFNQLESFPESLHDDMVDASADAFVECANMNFDIGNLL